jgi:hypothetical protein
MGPYCKFCDSRCFVPLPQGTPQEALVAYEGYDIIATCSAGQAFEMKKVGWSYSRIQEVIVNTPLLLTLKV